MYMRALDRIFRVRQIVGATRKVFSPKDLFANGEQGVWYDPSDLTTRYQDAAGTTPVTAVEQPVGLILDKRDTAYSTYFDGSGDRLTIPINSAGIQFGSGDFTVEAWVYLISNTTSGLLFAGQVDMNTVANSSVAFYVGGSKTSDCYIGTTAYVITSPVPTINSWTHVAFVRKGGTYSSFLNGTRVGTKNNLGTLSVNVGSTSYPPCIGAFGQNDAPLNGYISNLRIVKGTAIYDAEQASFTTPTAPLTPVAGTALLTCGTSWSGNPAITNVGNTRADKLNPFTVGTGNHAFQTTSTKRPVLSARYNLLTKTERFAQLPWAAYNATIQDNTSDTLDPIGGNNASKAIYGGASAGFYVEATMNTSYKYSIYAKKGTYDVAKVAVAYVTPSPSATFNMTSGVASGVDCTASMTSIENDWWLCTIVFTVSGSARIVNYCGTTTGHNLYYFGASLVPANQSSLPYQRVNTATDYDTQGFPTYLKFDGIDDSMQTNSIDFTATDKMTVFAGVRKLSDAAIGILTELSVNTDANNGTFFALAPSQGNTGSYRIRSKGTTVSDAEIISGRQAPITNILTGISNISGDQAILRVNGTQAAINTGDQGTGNYGNYPLYIGARAGSSLYFNGHLYNLIVRGAQSTDAQIEATENWLEVKTFGKDMSYVYVDEVQTRAGEAITTALGEQIYMQVNYQ